MNRVRLVALAGLIGMIALAVPGAAKIPSEATRIVVAPDVHCPPVTLVDSCLSRVSFFGQGIRSIKGAKPYQCPRGNTKIATQRIQTGIIVDLRASGPPCAEELLFSHPMRLIATGITIRRMDGLADFYGSFQLGTADARGGLSRVLVSGCIELMEQVGSHHGTSAINGPRPCEACDQKPHTEGWLMGRGTSAFRPGTLRAILVASSPFPDPKTLKAPFTPTVDGVWIQR